MTTEHAHHPAARWAAAARAREPAHQTPFRLAAMAGHMGVDRLAARRAALVDLLADGRPHSREAIWTAVRRQLGADPWGRLPREALARDLRALRAGGLRIAYSRRPGAAGYYLQYPPLAAPEPAVFEVSSRPLVDALRRLSLPEKNARAFAAAGFALTQRRLLLAEEHADWSTAQVDAAARRQVYGVDPVDGPSFGDTGS